MKLDIAIEKYPLITPLRITGRAFHTIDVITLTVTDEAGVTGQAEAVGVYYFDETPEKMIGEIRKIEAEVTSNTTRDEIQHLLPPGGARNALDCAYWDLEAKRAGASVWALTGIDPAPLRTVYTIGIEDTVEAMAEKAAEAREYPLLKIKLDGTDSLERMKAIRNVRPDAEIVVDVNQGWNFEQLHTFAPEFARLGVSMIEQPLPRGADEVLEGYTPPIPLCADESCLYLDELPVAAQRYQMINIKLDKTGGLTEALKLAEAAKERGLDLMVGCMCGSSLSMAPGFVIGQLCRFVDLDGPLLLKHDRDHPIRYENGMVFPPSPKLWG